jgi:hypothetical protein
MHKHILIIFVLFFLQSSQAENTPNGYEPVVKQFYDWRFKAQFTGVPEASMLKKASRFLSPELSCLLDRARDYRDRFAKKFPTDKPLFIEGDMFTSMFEGANRYVLESASVKDKNGLTADVAVHLFHDQGAQIGKVGWRDHILLQYKKPQWRITDIVYGGGFDFGNSGSLRQNLLDELSQDNKDLNWIGKAQLKLCR